MLQIYKLHYQLIIILILMNLSKSLEEDLKIGNITIKDGKYFAENFNIISTNKNNLKTNKKNKLCVIENIEDFYKFCKPFVKIFYNKWVK